MRFNPLKKDGVYIQIYFKGFKVLDVYFNRLSMLNEFLKKWL